MQVLQEVKKEKHKRESSYEQAPNHACLESDSYIARKMAVAISFILGGILGNAIHRTLERRRRSEKDFARTKDRKQSEACRKRKVTPYQWARGIQPIQPW